MSTRWYPIYQRGNPQLRVFLPNFWLKLIRPETPQPNNVVVFSCSMQMTKHDITNYLKEIYQVPVVDVRTRIAMGKTKKNPLKGYIIKEDDSKLAYVTLVSSLWVILREKSNLSSFTAEGCEIRVPRPLPGQEKGWRRKGKEGIGWNGQRTQIVHQQEQKSEESAVLVFDLRMSITFIIVC